MKNSILLFLFCFLGFNSAHAFDLKVGDVLLQPLKCWSCTLIETEEETIFSHAGVVLSIDPIVVAEALASVRTIPLKAFEARTEPGQKILVLRFKNEQLVHELQFNSQKFKDLFDFDFAGRKYDHDFLWNNLDEADEEKFYCSELITKLFQAFAGVELPIKRMHFERNREAWLTYFRGNPPDQEWGNSPGDLHRSALFYEVGEL